MTVDSISINGEVFESESESTFSTGTFQSNSVAPGFGRGDTLHINGRFQYGGNTESDLVKALGGFWYAIDETPSIGTFNGALTLGPCDANSGAWRYLDIRGGEDFRVTAKGMITTDVQIPQDVVVVFGVDFYDASGVKIGDAQGSFGPDQQGAEASISGVATLSTVTSTAWVVLLPGAVDANAKLTLTKFEVSSIPDVTDTEPPVANLVTTSVTYRSQDPFAQPLSFVVDLSDNVGSS